MTNDSLNVHVHSVSPFKPAWNNNTRVRPRASVTVMDDTFGLTVIRKSKHIFVQRSMDCGCGSIELVLQKRDSGGGGAARGVFVLIKSSK